MATAGKESGDHESSPAERVELAVARLEALAHQNPMEHSVLEEIYFRTTLRDGRPVEVYMDYELPEGLPEDSAAESRLQCVIAGVAEPETYMFNMDDVPERQTTYTLPSGQVPVVSDPTLLMALRLEEVIEQAELEGVPIEVR